MSKVCFRLFCFMLVLVAVAGEPLQARTQTSVSIDPIPKEVQSDFFRITVQRQRSLAFHAVAGYYLLNFEVSGPTQISITAKDPEFWKHGVEVQPMRLGIRPVRRGATISFSIPGPGKIVVTRPGDHFAKGQMLFLFANAPEKTVTRMQSGLRYYSPGIHHENIDAQSGDRIYLAPGAVVYGALNVWQVHNVHVFGQGTIIYDGPQNPNDDEGWMHKRNWHCIVMDQARNVEIDGITCIVRSRTWQIQLKDSRHIGFYNIKVIGGSRNNANQDGMDFLGCGDITVANSFFRAADDDFAIIGNWDGYTAEELARPGHEVSNITIRDSVVSTSISNTMRVNWPHKHFNSANVQMLNMDVLHTGYGGCGVPFALFELWADPGGSGTHTNYLFRDIRLEDWYSLVGIYQPLPLVSNIHFRDIWAMDRPAMVPSVLSGDVDDIYFQNVVVDGHPARSIDDIPLRVLHGAKTPFFSGGDSPSGFGYQPGALRPHQPVLFHAAARAGWTYQWLFGDGTQASGASVRHSFADAEGTLLDGTGRYRVLLHGFSSDGEQTWSSRGVVVANHMHPALAAPEAGGRPGWAIRRTAHGVSYSAYLQIPADGGYTLTLLTSVTASLTLDDMTATGLPAQPQVCGSTGNAVQPQSISGVLQHGLHRIIVEKEAGPDNADDAGGPDFPVLQWEGPSVPMQRVPQTAIVQR